MTTIRHIPLSSCVRPSEKALALAGDVALRHGVTLQQLLTTKRFRKAAWARHEAMHLARMVLGCSYPVIGATFNCDHSTAIYGVRKHQDRLAGANVENL